MSYDVLIKSGLLLDGSGGEPSISDIGVKGEKIARIGSLGKSAGKFVINAEGKYVTPGFIDVANHSDTHLTIFRYPLLESLLMQGVTTILGGMCGASLAPLGSHEAIDAISKWTDPSETNINWSTMEEFLSHISRMRLGVNFGTLAGFGTLKRSVIGKEARQLDPEEREKVKFLLGRSLEQGAFGISLGLSYGHERASPTEEIIEIVKILRQRQGVTAIHLRSEGSELLGSVNEAIRIGRETGAKIEISHLKAVGKKSWALLPRSLELIERARETGLDINFDVSPYHSTGSLLYLLLPVWARQSGLKDLAHRLGDKGEREKIIEALKSSTLHYDKILITQARTKSALGHTLAQIAEETNMPPEEALLEILRGNEGRVSIIGKTVSRKNTERALVAKNSFIASDGEGYGQEAVKEGVLTHPRSFGAFPHFWHRCVADQKLISAGEAIRKMTSGPAEKFGIQKRGLLKKGYFADITVFDPRLFRDRATYLNPFRFPAGMEWVLVNGSIAVEQGRVLGLRHGTVLYTGI